MIIPGANPAGSAASSSQLSAAKPQEDVVQSFLDYMKETPAQRMEDAWLNAHHMTRKEFEALSPEKKGGDTAPDGRRHQG
jgi:hypothetical protein